MRRGRLILLALMTIVAVAASPAPAAQAPTRLRIAIPGSDGSLTPYTFESAYALMSLVYDTLTWRDAQGVAQPWLARSIHRDSTGTVLDVRLRAGVRWQDGARLTAEDVAFTYRYMSQHPHPRFTPELQDIARVDATGELSVRFTLRRRSLGFEDQPLADVPILPRHLWQHLARGQVAPPGLPIGTGPYRMTSYRPGHAYRFQANKGYFRGTPSVARIDVPIIRREDSIFDELRRSQLDAVPLTVPPGTTPPHLPGVLFSDAVSYTGTMLLFNVDARPFDRPVARRAVSDALDLDAIAANATGVAGGVVAADRGMLEPSSPWASADVLHHYRPAAARLAFAEQGVGPFRVAAPRNDPVRLIAGERVVRALTETGARAKLVKLSPKAMDRALGRNHSAPTFDVAVVGIPALASYDPAYLRAMFGDPHSAPLNDGGYRSPQFDALATRTASAATQQARHADVEQQLRLLARELPAVPLLFGGGTFAYRPVAYNGWVSIRGSGILDKRSFLAGNVSHVKQPSAPGAVTDLVDPGDDQSFSLVPIIIGFAALMLAGLIWWLRRSRH